MSNAPNSLLAWAERNPELKLLFDPQATEEELDQSIERLIDKAIRWLEDNANDLKDASENLLSTTLAGKISMPGLRADRERNINGHVDIIIEIEGSYPQRRWLAEAKIWRGPSYHVEGLEQLLGYVTGRDRSSYVFDYVKLADIDGKWKSLRLHLDTSLPSNQQTACSDCHGGWTFETRHKHSCGKVIRIVHYGVNLHR